MAPCGMDKHLSSDDQWPSRQATATTAAVGVTKTQLFFQETAKWLFREQPLEDYGIDAHVETVERGNVKGRLFALQIKSGDSWLRPSATGGWNFYPEKKHVTYWQNHSLPVAIVVWHESSDTLYFREASPHTLEETGSGGWRLHLGDDDLLAKSALPTLTRLSMGTTYDLRLRELRLLLPWMQRITQGQRLILEADEWVNKTWGKGNLEITAIAEDGTKHPLGKWGVALGSEPYETALPALFGWADLVMNPDVECDSEEEYGADTDWESVHWTDLMTPDAEWPTEEEHETDRDPEAIRPYANSINEIDHWSLELRLNKIGRAFLLLDEYARQGQQLQLGL